MAMNFIERLRNTNDVLVYFGPMPTLLAGEYGYPLEEHVSVWIVDHPKEFQDALRRIYATGHDCAQIATQSTSPFRSKPFGQAVVERVYELNYTTAKLAKEVTPEGRYIIGIIGTTTPDFMEPVGNMTYDEVYEGYLEQIKGLAGGGVDSIAVCGNEIEQTEIVIKAIQDHYPDIPVIARHVFYAGKKGFRTMQGLDPKTASARLNETGAEVIGFSCGLMTKSLMIMPDPGVPVLIEDKTVWPVSPEEMASEVPNWIDVGARIIAGCCGTSLEHGMKVSDVVRERGLKGL